MFVSDRDWVLLPAIDFTYLNLLSQYSLFVLATCTVPEAMEWFRHVL